MTYRSAIRSKIILIIFASAAVYLAGNGTVSLWDRDEPRYAQTSRQMLQSGDWVVPHLLSAVRTAKPIFIYWCQASAMKVFGDNAFAARFPSSIAMTLTLIMLAIVIYRTIGRQRAMWTVFILGTSALAIAAAKMCLTDSVLLLFITSAQICLAAIYLRNRDLLPKLPNGARWAEDVLRYGSGPIPEQKPQPLVPAILWISIALAGLTKGPVVIGVSLTTMLVLALLDLRDGRYGHFLRRIIGWWGKTYPILGLVIVAVICAPWLILIHHRAPEFLPMILGHDVVDRMRSGLEGHKGPPGYYLLLIWVTYFPWSLLLPATIIHAWKRRHLPVIRFALAAVIGPWIMFELVVTKLPHYILPTFPFLAFLTADMLVCTARRVARVPRPSHRIFIWIVGVWGIVVIGAACLPWFSMRVFRPYIDSAAIWAMVFLTLIAIEYARQVFVYFRANSPLDAAAVMGIGMLLIVWVFYVGYLPHAQFLRTSQRIADTLHAHNAANPIMIDYKEDTLPWCEGGTIRGERDNDFLLHHPASEWPNFIVLTGEVWRRTPFDVQNQFDVLDTIRGWAYSDGGRIVDVFVLSKRNAQLSTSNAQRPTSSVAR